MQKSAFLIAVSLAAAAPAAALNKTEAQAQLLAKGVHLPHGDEGAARGHGGRSEEGPGQSESCGGRCRERERDPFHGRITGGERLGTGRPALQEKLKLLSRLPHGLWPRPAQG